VRFYSLCQTLCRKRGPLCLCCESPIRSHCKPEISVMQQLGPECCLFFLTWNGHELCSEKSSMLFGVNRYGGTSRPVLEKDCPQ
jgi:hypothetical protein